MLTIKTQNKHINIIKIIEIIKMPNEMDCKKTIRHKETTWLLCAVGFALYDPLPWLSEKITGLHSSACEPTFCGNSGNRGFPLMVIMTLCSGAAAGSRMQHLQLLWQYFVAYPMSYGPYQHDSTIFNMSRQFKFKRPGKQCYIQYIQCYKI